MNLKDGNSFLKEAAYHDQILAIVYYFVLMQTFRLEVNSYGSIAFFY